MTSLQKQLAAIAASSTHQLDLKAQRAAHGKSLLFEPKVAVSQSFDTLYLICYEGFRDLCALDPRFLSFSKTVFSEQSKAEDRTQMTKKENAELDAVLEAFITLVGPRLLLKPAEKAVEWLVRRFRVHEYNTECLVLSYLPYHATPQFLALLSILPSSPPPTLRFLFPYITSPTNPPRKTIVYTAVNTPSFFIALQGYIVKVLKAGHQGSNLLSFWSGITTQAIDGILEQSQSGRREIQDQRTEELLFRVLPALNECLKISTVPEAVLGCYMIIIVLVTKGAFEDKILDTLMEAVIRSQEAETLEGCLMCLAMIAEERSHVSIPQPVTRGLLKILSVAQSLKLLSKTCRVERLALGCALGALDTIEKSIRLEESRSFCQDVASLGLLDDSRFSIFLSTLLRLISNKPPGSAQHRQLLEIITELSEQTNISHLLETVAKDNGANLEALGISFRHAIDSTETQKLESDDEDMYDIDQDLEPLDDAFPIAVPSTTVSTFLDGNSSESFQAVLLAFEQAASSEARIRRFLSSENLRREDAFSEPLYFSFLIRTWCSPTSVPVKIAAIRSASTLIKKVDGGIDLQNFIPYLLYALTDPASAVRRAAATCIRILSMKASSAERASTYRIWGTDNMYNKDSARISPLSKGQTSTILSSVFIPVLEECVMDSKFITISVRSILSKNEQGHNLKSSLRTPLISFLASHAASTPLLRMRLCLFPLFNVIGKSTNSVRTSILLPVVRAWCSISSIEAAATCGVEQIDIKEVDRGYLATFMARESESMELLRDVLSATINKERCGLQDSGFERLVALWPSMKADSQLIIGESLLDLALKQNSANTAEELSKTRSLETLRNVKLSTAVLQRFIESIPSAVQMPEGPPAKKRRRTSRNEMARVELQSSEDVTRLLQKLTLVLELIEGSNPGEHTALFRNLFTILGDLQQLKQQSGSDLVYLQSLVLSSLTPMVSQLKGMKDSSEYQSCVRADLLIDCIRHSTSPQVQNGALLLIANLASWVPELILHNLMPIFTFIGSTLLRQKDDYSAHVVDQTISRVVPQLAASLKTKHRDFLTGVADLLLSFTAAFEHIPQHRRLKLFTELAQTLGPQDSLAAIVALLVDRYPASSAQRKFTSELLLKFEPMVTLEMFRGYLALVAGAISDQRKPSDLFSLKEKQPAQVDNTINHLLSSLADLATDRSVQSHISRAFRKSRDSSKPQAVFADIVETIIQLSKKVSANQRLYGTCSRVLAKCLDLLPTIDLIKSVELLLTNSDPQVKVAVIKSVEVRAGSITQNDQQSVSSLLSFITQIDKSLQQPNDVSVIIIAVSCIDRIVERFGKKDIVAVSGIAHTISNILINTDDRVRILSLLCLTSIVDVLEEEAIALLPTVLPTAFEYLKDGIEQKKDGLHNAVFSLLSDIIQRLSFIFSRDYLVSALELAQRSAVSDLDEPCDESRRQFYQSVSKHLGAKEAFSAIKATWPSAISQGSEAIHEQLDLVYSTIENQSKARLIQASSTLFSFLLDAFELRHAIESRKEDVIEEEEVDELENSLIESVISMTLKLNDTTFRPFFVQLVDFANSKEEKDLQRSITFFKFLAAFFDRFKSIVTSYSSYIIEPASQLLSNLTTQPSSQLRTAILTALQSSFAHDQDSFWQSPSHFSTILTPLLAQLTINSATEVSEYIIPAITEFATSSSSSAENHREMNAILLKYMRAEEAHTRLATVKCEQSLTKRLGEEWLALLPEMLPFISELREDDDEMVERETQRWITAMEEILGEDLEGMLQ